MKFTTTFKTSKDIIRRKNKANTTSDGRTYQRNNLQCESTYIGETSRNPKACICEYRKDLRFDNPLNSLEINKNKPGHNKC